MSISRRTLLSTLVGLPFGVKVAQATEIGDITVTGISRFDKQRIEDIGDAFFNCVERSLIFRGIRHTSRHLPGDNVWGSYPLVPWSDSEKSIQNMVQTFVMPGVEAIIQGLVRYYDSKARWVGVQIYHHHEGLAVSMLATQGEKPLVKGNALYSKWARTL